MLGLGPQEIMAILVILLLLFGGTKLPELARSLGKSKREFEEGLREEKEVEQVEEEEKEKEDKEEKRKEKR